MNRVRPLSLLSAGILSAFALVTFANSSSGETVSKPEGNSSEVSPRPDKVWFVTGSNKGLGLAISTAALFPPMAFHPRTLQLRLSTRHEVSL